jgi:hypothetical protein
MAKFMRSTHLQVESRKQTQTCKLIKKKKRNTKQYKFEEFFAFIRHLFVTGDPVKIACHFSFLSLLLRAMTARRR